MADQLNMLSTGQIISTALHTEMQQSYLEYAMSVIVGRALPDVRDGLKPVHRRILYAMHELGLTPDRPYRKCARVVGDVLGKYHPHGDQAVYDALVRMVQDFSSRYPLLAGHGNFGSVDDDPPAAMRYTETRLAPISNEALLSEIGDATVDFAGNFDNSQQEPVVLPAQLPILLLNGSSGIAVGMATNIPPHNLGELVDGLIALIDRPTMSDEDLFTLIPGPDFPTGGEIIDTEGIREAYTTGRGSIPVRGVSRFEEIQPGRGRHRRPAIIVSELPYQVNKAAWIEKIADLVTQGRLEGIADIRDESDRAGIRVVIELKREANPQKILAFLHKQTALQNNFGAIFLALVDGQPRQMSLRELLQEFLSFREATLTRRYRHELTQAENRLHIVEGMLTALDNLDQLIDILRHAPDGSTAKLTLQEELDLSDRQADAILAMPLRRLTGLERQNLRQEADELSTQIAELQKLLGDRRELLKALKKDLRALKKKYGNDRRTRILTASASPAAEQTSASDLGQPITEAQLLPLSAELEEEAEDIVLEITQRGYARRLTPKTFERQRSRRDQPTGVLAELDDLAIQTQFITTAQPLVAITRSGKAYPIKPGEIAPATGRNARGVPLITLLPASAQASQDAIALTLPLPQNPGDTHLLLVTAQGRIKRLPLAEFAELSGRGLTLLKLKEDDHITQAIPASIGQSIVLATSSGRLIRLAVDDQNLPLLSRTAQGNPAMRLGKKDRLVGCVALESEDELFLITAKGYGKRLPVDLLRYSNPGELGSQVLQFATKTDGLAGMAAISTQSEDIPELVGQTSANRFVWLEATNAPLEDRDGQGDRLLTLPADETLTMLISPSSSG
jgi:DNA gyrase subunit A